jgi:hypothetical protein
MVFQHHNILDGYNNYIDYYKEMPKRNLMSDYMSEYEYKTRHNETIRDIHNEIGINSAKIRKLESDLGSDVYANFPIHEAINKLSGMNAQLNKKLRTLEWVDMKTPECMTIEELHDYYDLEIFNDCIMLNISPKWPGGVGGHDGGLEDKIRIKFLKIVIDAFINDKRNFSKHKFVIECGKEGTHIHAHCVLELQPSKIKHLNTWLSKGKHHRDLRTIWDKIAKREDCLEYVGAIKAKPALQTQILRTSELRDDKLDYLIEERKPLSHQNAQHPQCPQTYKHGFD